MVPMYEHDVLNSCMEILHEILYMYGFVYATLDLVRMSRVEIMYEINVRTYVGKMLYASVVWKRCTDVWKSCVDILNERFVWKSCTEVMCGIYV